MFHMNDLSGTEAELNERIRALGSELAIARKRRGWTQAELARRASSLKGLPAIKTKQIGLIENGHRGQFHQVWQLAVALNVELKDLIKVADAEVDKRLREDRAN